jgi:CBS domain-containing protein
MQVRDVMSREVELINPDMDIRDAASRMREADIGALPVGERDRLVGMLTDRDIATRAVADGKGPGSTTVRQVMSRGVRYCFDDSPLDDACRVMEEHQVRRLPVVNRDKRLVGVVSLADVARRGNGDGLAEEALREISEPTGTPRR